MVPAPPSLPSDNATTPLFCCPAPADPLSAVPIHPTRYRSIKVPRRLRPSRSAAGDGDDRARVLPVCSGSGGRMQAAGSRGRGRRLELSASEEDWPGHQDGRLLCRTSGRSGRAEDPPALLRVTRDYGNRSRAPRQSRNPAAEVLRSRSKCRPTRHSTARLTARRGPLLHARRPKGRPPETDDCLPQHRVRQWEA